MRSGMPSSLGGTDDLLDHPPGHGRCARQGPRRLDQADELAVIALLVGAPGAAGETRRLLQLACPLCSESRNSMANSATAEANRMSSVAAPVRSATGVSSSLLVEPFGSLYRSRTVTAPSCASLPAGVEVS